MKDKDEVIQMSIENQSNTTVRKAIGWTIFLSIILIILGVLALLAPMYASAFFCGDDGLVCPD